MDKARRMFMGYISILGIVGFSGISLQAQPLHVGVDEGVCEGYRDSEFDPDGWL